MFVTANLPAAVAIAAGLFTGMLFAILFYSRSADSALWRGEPDDAPPDLRMEHALQFAEALTPEERVWVLHWLETRYGPAQVGGRWAPSRSEGTTTR